MTSLATSSTGSVTAASVAASTTASTSAASGSGASATALSQSDFLKLLTAQLQYQSPMNPADPTQMASEFAQIATVDGVDKLNSQISTLQSATTASQMGQAADLVGKQVAVSGDTMTANASGVATGAFTLPSAASNVTATILNANGTLAGTVNLGALGAGQQSFQWSGGTAGDQYTYAISAADNSGNAVQAATYSVHTVEGVNISGASPTLNVAGSDTPLAASSVTTVLGAS
ncbi:MAG TPA: flagellar hook capping FlgD N-terminal domain-containing protein [Acidocella sp.]|nr:flagellar hook capping FlgD N-terminal domain-containing protein [Acidocella sp.]